jgi:hypothetical protein
VSDVYGRIGGGIMAAMLDKRPVPPQETPTALETGGDPEYAARYRRARERVEAVRGFYVHLTVYLTVNAFLLVINLLTSRDSLWFYWPLLGWGAAVAIHGLVVFGTTSRWGAGWEQRKIHEYMEEGEPGEQNK